MLNEASVVVSASSSVEWAIDEVRRALTGSAYPEGTVTVSVRLYDSSFLTPIGSAIAGAWDGDAQAWVVPIPAVGTAYGKIGAQLTVTADGNTLVERAVLPVVA